MQCQACKTYNLPGGKTACSRSGSMNINCIVCEDCMCPNCDIGEFCEEHCSCLICEYCEEKAERLIHYENDDAFICEECFDDVLD